MTRGRSLRPSVRTDFFNNSSNVRIKNTNILIEAPCLEEAYQNAYQDTGERLMDLLLSHCALDALVDSSERYDPPRCSQGTRVALQSDLIDWINSPTQVARIAWLKGSAGSGKSAIAQTIAEHFDGEKQTMASFFFSRTSGSASRVDGNRLIPTLVYQLSLQLPEYRNAVFKRLRKDPAIFQKSRSAQMVALFTQPLQRFSYRRWLRNLFTGAPLPLVIIIDGLDECRDMDIQCDLLRIIADTAASIRNYPVRFLICSRSETHIMRIFDHYPAFKTTRCRRIDLDEDPDAAVAIMVFVRQQFRTIRETHPLRHYLSPDWPNEDTLDLLVTKSTPQFILVSAATSYIASPKHQPPERLRAVVELLCCPNSKSGDQPLRKLDLLYSLIFEAVEDEHRCVVHAALGILHLSSTVQHPIPPPTTAYIEKLLALDPGDITLRLEPLVSVIHVPNNPQNPIRSLHASLFDFLLNDGRSQEHKLQIQHAEAALVGHYIRKGSERAHYLAQQPGVQSSPIFSSTLQALILSMPRSGDPFSAAKLEARLSHVQLCLEWHQKYDIQPGKSLELLQRRIKRRPKDRVHQCILPGQFSSVGTIYTLKHTIYADLWMRMPTDTSNIEAICAVLQQHRVAALHLIIFALEELCQRNGLHYLTLQSGDYTLPDSLLLQETDEAVNLIGICHKIFSWAKDACSTESICPDIPSYCEERAHFCRTAWRQIFSLDVKRSIDEVHASNHYQDALKNCIQ